MAKIRYFSKVPGASFTFENGKKIQFAHGFYETSDETEQREFAAILPPLGNNPMIFTQETAKAVEQMPKIAADKNAASETQIAQQDAILANAAQGNFATTGEVNQINIAADPNASAVDTNLQAKIFKEVPGTGMSRAEEIKAKLATGPTGA